MCGICGIALTKGQQPERARLERMNEALYHRGPDSDGFFLGQGVGLAMRRLAIIDLATGRQPIPNEDETLWVVLNGEIYNFQEKRAWLLERGHRFRTRTDTEIILHLYEEFGTDCVQHLRGQFAFALWDERRRRLLIARDRLGQKPLFYSLLAGNLYFSSELTSLLTGLPARPELDISMLDMYLALQYIPDPWTAYQGVYKLPPAHMLVWEGGEVRITPYWRLPYGEKWRHSEAELAAILREKLTEAVRLRLIADVPLGAHLSGGIDSSIIVALMAQLSERPVKTFSIGFKEQGFSELSYARAVANRYGTEHTEFIVTHGDVPAVLDEIIPYFGEPFADSSALPLFHLARLTREHVTVTLNGDGGDDLLAGYLRYWLDPWGDRYLRLPGWARRMVNVTAQRLVDGGTKPVGHDWVNGLKRLSFLDEIPPEASILRWGSYFFPSQRRNLWRQEYLESLDLARPATWLQEQYRALPEAGRLDRTLYADEMTYLPGDLLVKADRMTMAHSLEGRSPFLDHILVEWAVRLPEKYKLRGRQGKYLLRKAFARDLPVDVLRHKKQGFGIPLGLWFRQGLAGWAERELLSPVLTNWMEPTALRQLLAEHQRGVLDHGRRIWTLVVLKKWLELVG